MGRNNHINVKIYQSVEVSVAQVAESLAEKDHEAQAEFFNKFATALIKRCEDKHHFELQMIDIESALNEDGKRLINDLVEFGKLKEQEDKN